MRFTTFLLTLMLTFGMALSSPLAQTDGQPQDEPAAKGDDGEESEEADRDDAFVVPSEEETEGEDEGARPPTTKQGEEREDDDTEPVDTEPTMFTSCSQTAPAPATTPWLLLVVFVGFVRRRSERRTTPPFSRTR